MIKKYRFSAALTLVELMIACLVIGVLVAITVPIYLKHAETSMGSKALENLQNIFNAQTTYMNDHETFTSNRADLNSYVSIAPDDADWVFSIVSTQTTFTATATRQRGSYTGSMLTINQDSVITGIPYPP